MPTPVPHPHRRRWMIGSVFVAAAIAFPVVLLLAVLGMERVEHRLNRPSTVLTVRTETVEVLVDTDPSTSTPSLSAAPEGAT